MKFTPIVSEKDIKTLLLEEAEALKSGQKPRLIILSRRRFQKFSSRDDVWKSSYNWGDMVIESDDLDYRVYENKKVAICKCYGIVTLQIIGGFYIVKKLFDCDEYNCWNEEPSEIIFIE